MTTNQFTVFASWIRAAAECIQPGTYTVGMDVIADIPPGQSRVLRGDGGLRIEMTRTR